jgi:hypothetical protein
MEFDFQRFAGRKRGGNPLVQPESYFLFVFRVFWFRLLCAGGNSQEATAQYSKRGYDAPNGRPLAVEIVAHTLSFDFCPEYRVLGPGSKGRGICGVVRDDPQIPILLGEGCP